MAITTTTVSGTIVDPSNAAETGGQAVFTLLGFGSALPRVLGSAIIALQVQANTNASGLFSISIIPNASIAPGGTYYQVDFFSSQGHLISTQYYQVSGTTMDLDSASPFVPPLPVAPSVTPSTPVAPGVVEMGSLTGAAVLPLASGTIIHATLTGDVTFTLSSIPAGGQWVIWITQDATGSHHVVWPSNVHGAGAPAYTALTDNVQAFFSNSTATTLYAESPMVVE